MQARRRELGAYYTPSPVAARLTDLALGPLGGAPRVCDPACGDGAFLLAAADHLAARGISRETIAGELLWGTDVDPDAVDRARAAISAWAGVAPNDHIRVGDGLAPSQQAGRFDAVIGNPPFLNQLERATVRTAATRWSGVVGPYADTAFLFVLSALELVRPGGRVVLVQPQSLAAARDAAAVRDRVAHANALVAMWTCNDAIFDASVRVCAVVLERDAPQPEKVRRYVGVEVTEHAPAAWRAQPTWSTYLVTADPPPAVALDGRRTLGELVSATAGFRDQFYGLAPAVFDAPDSDAPKLVTCGLIDPARCAWGERPVRFAGRRWQHPRVDLAAIERPAVRRWVHERLAPKVVVATQTKVIEAAVDVEGRWVPSTPVIAVHCDPHDLFRVGAVLHAPPASAWALSAYAGTALAPDAIKLSARQVGAIPLPADDRAWNDGAAALEAGDLEMTAHHMTSAYGAGAEVLGWWANRWQRQ